MSFKKILYNIYIYIYIHLKKRTKFRFNGRQKTAEENFLPDIFISSHISEIFAWTDPDPPPRDTKTLPFFLCYYYHSLLLKPERMIAGPTASTISFHNEQRLVIAWISVSCGSRGNCSHCCGQESRGQLLAL